MNFKNVTDSELIQKTKNAIGIETTATTNVVRHFKEIFERDLYLARGYSSMFLMAVEEFGYDNSSAIRRTNALELALAVPSVLEKIDQGQLCLQAAADIQAFLNKERGRKKTYTNAQKAELVETCTGLSTRDLQIELATRNPDLDFKESKKFISKDRMRVTYVAQATTEKKLERIKNFRSQAHPYMTRDQLIDYMAEKTLDAIDPVRKDARHQKRATKKRDAEHATERHETEIEQSGHDGRVESELRMVVREEVVSEPGEIQLAVDFDETPKLQQIESPRAEQVSAPKVPLKRSRYVSARDRRDVRKVNGENGCAFVAPVSGRRCGSSHQLQYDHCLEFSKGGSNDSSNLEVLCAKHNRYRWRQRSGSYVKTEARQYG